MSWRSNPAARTLTHIACGLLLLFGACGEDDGGGSTTSDDTPSDVTEDVAQFLLVRQEYAYIGYSWMGCIQPDGFVQVSIAGLLLHHSEDSQMTRSRAGQRYRLGRVSQAKGAGG